MLNNFITVPVGLHQGFGTGRGGGYAREHRLAGETSQGGAIGGVCTNRRQKNMFSAITTITHFGFSPLADSSERDRNRVSFKSVS